ncbi:MAG: lysylphosphatidylglycerol synthase transmembrane domain-containing protein [Phototrophicaceae bacterium]
MTEATAPSTRPQTWRRIAWLIVRLIFVAVIFTLIFRRADLDTDTLLAQANEIRWGWVALALALWIGSSVVASLRWKTLLDVVHTGVSLWPLVWFNWVGVFYAQFLPGMVSGDLVRGYYLARGSDDKVNIVASALMDRVLGIVANGLIGLAALAVSPLVLETFQLEGNVLAIVAAVIVFGLLVGYGAVLILNRVSGRFPMWLNTLYAPIQRYSGHPVQLGLATLYSVGFFGVWAAGLWALAAGVQLAYLGFTTILLLLAVINVAQFLPISLNGLGVREAAVVAVLAAYGVAQPAAFVYALLITAMGFVIALLGGLLVLIDYRK